MIELNDVISFIENKYGVRLFDFQKQMLGAIINGQVLRVPRCCGKTMLINGYKDYLESLYVAQPEDYDFQIGGIDVANTGLLSMDLMRKQARQAQKIGKEQVFEEMWVVNINDVLKE